MYKLNLFSLAIALTIIATSAVAQNNTNSPYTRYGYGNLADKAFAAQRGMGGIGYGLRDSKLINPMNPASFSAVDSMTFMFDLGVTGQLSWFEDGENKENKFNGNIEYLALQFPIAKRMGIGVGLEPVSYVGYEYGGYAQMAGSDYSTFTYKGTGGLSKVYTSLAYNFFDRLSLGVKLAYQFGDLRHTTTTSSSIGGNYSIMSRDTMRLNAFTYDIGLQYTHPLGKRKNIVIGAVYTPKISMNNSYRTSTLRYDPSSNSIIDNELYIYRDSVYQMPESYGLGITYSELNKLTVGVDALYQKWSEAKFHDQTGQFYDRWKFNVGGEYIPQAFGYSYFRKIRYRAGFSYSDSYLKIKDAGYKEYGASLGLGLPMTDKRSLLNIAFEYSMIRPDKGGLIDEQYFKLTVSYTFNELWFFKRKVQ